MQRNVRDMAQEMKLSEQEETKGEGWNMEEEIWDSGAKINPPEILGKSAGLNLVIMWFQVNFKLFLKHSGYDK